MSYTDTMLVGMPRQETLRRLCLLYEGSQGAQPNVNQIMERTGLSRRAAFDYWNAMRRVNVWAQTIGKTDPETSRLIGILRRILRYAPRDNRPNLRRVQRNPVSYDLVNIAEMPLLSEAQIAVKELTCPGPSKKRITYARCPFDDLDEKEKGSCEKCQKKGYARKLPEWKARVSIVTERQVFEESVLKCAREVEARRQML